MGNIYFVYMTLKNNVGGYALSDACLTRGDEYLHGFCETRGHYRTFKNERVIEYFESLGEAVDFTESICATNKLDFNISANGGAFLSERRYKKYETPGMLAPSDFSTTPEICFTGFKKEDKERLSQKAKEAGMIVRKDITVNLHYLCGGYNAGPKKLEVAQKKGTLILHEIEFLALIETGELPDDYDENQTAED